MPVDSQALKPLEERKLAAQGSLQDATDKLAKAQQDVTTFTTSVATLTDEIADIDAALAAVTAL